MKNNIKKAPVKCPEDQLFSAFYADFCLCPKSVVITILRQLEDHIEKMSAIKTIYV